MGSITRRDFVKTVALVGAVAVGGGLLRIPKVLTGKPNPSTRNPLYIPPTVSPLQYQPEGSI